MKKKRLLQALAGCALVLALAAMVLFHSGCSKLLPTAPGTADSANDLWSGSSDGDDTLTSEWSEICSADGGRWFGSRGAVINLVVNSEHLLFQVPPNALHDWAYITVKITLFGRLFDQEEQYKLEYEFTPDGLIFAKPAQILFQSKAIEAEEGDYLTLYWLNPLTGRWEPEDVVKVNPTLVMVKFDIHHFSRYAIGCSSLPPNNI